MKVYFPSIIKKQSMNILFSQSHSSTATNQNFATFLTPVILTTSAHTKPSLSVKPRATIVRNRYISHARILMPYIFNQLFLSNKYILRNTIEILSITLPSEI